MWEIWLIMNELFFDDFAAIYSLVVAFYLFDFTREWGKLRLKFHSDNSAVYCNSLKGLYTYFTPSPSPPLPSLKIVDT